MGHRDAKAFPMMAAMPVPFSKNAPKTLSAWCLERTEDVELLYHSRRFVSDLPTSGHRELQEVSTPTLPAVDADEGFQARRRSIDFAVNEAVAREMRLSELVSDGPELCKGSRPGGGEVAHARFGLHHREELKTLASDLKGRV